MKKVRVLALFLLACVSLMSVTACKKEKAEIVKREKYIAHLNEKYADYVEVPYGLDITKKTDIVSICYSTWFTKILTGKKDPPNITNILAGKEKWGALYQFHYWAKPALGYYKSDNKEVIRTHMTQLSDAGIDFIIIDNTNANAGWIKTSDWKQYVTLPCEAILDTIVEMRAEGLKTPYVVFWSGGVDNPDTKWKVVEETYKQFMDQDKWKDCFVYWEGKPFMLTVGMAEEGKPDDLTLRRMWGLGGESKTEVWSFLDIKNTETKDKDGYAEQTCVCTAAQETYMSLPTAHGRNHGIFMYQQWHNAFQYRPKVITITWWNEWAAQRFEENGQNLFVDNYNEEYSRDIEPMEGGHGDQYYKWMKEYIRAYRALEDCPVLVEPGFEDAAAQALAATPVK